ncbi:MAG: DUF1905 domain-containing protein [Candidatus Eisenbacteria bacterium]
MSPERRGHRFRARLEQLGVNHCLDLPGQVSRALRADPHGGHRVRVTIGGVVFSANLEMRDAGLHRLYLPAHVWKDLHCEVGDLLVGRIESDDEAGGR